MTPKLKRAYVLKADGTKVALSDRPNLKEAQAAVGGYVELMPKSERSPRLTVYANEEGRLNGLPTNVQASELLGYAIVGDVVVLEGWHSLRGD